MIPINSDCFESTTWSPLTNTSTSSHHSKPPMSRPNHILAPLTPLTNTCMAHRPTPSASCAVPDWYSNQAHYVYPHRRDLPVQTASEPYMPTPPTRQNFHPSPTTARPFLMSSADQPQQQPLPPLPRRTDNDHMDIFSSFHHTTEIGRPSSASSSSSCMALTPTSTQFHVPTAGTVDEGVVFIEEFQAPSAVMGVNDEFLPQLDWRCTAAAAIGGAPLSHIWLPNSSSSSCMRKPQFQSMPVPYIDGAFSDSSDMWSDDDLSSMHQHHHDSYLPERHDNTGHDDNLQQQQQYDMYPYSLQHQQTTMRTHTPSHFAYSSALQSPPEPTSSQPVSPLASSSSCNSYQCSPSIASAESYNQASLPVHQPQPIRPIPIVPLSTLSSLATVDNSTLPSAGNHIIPVKKRSSNDNYPPHEQQQQKKPRSRLRQSPSAVKTEFLSPLSLLCQPVSDSVRYQIDQIDAINADKLYEGAQLMDDNYQNGPSPHNCHGTSGQLGGFFCVCGCLGSNHPSFMIPDRKGW